ncbi:MAG: hypothetical protein GY754_44490, partial [bacterium]|nr:hypothetical protein [bacterium]
AWEAGGNAGDISWNGGSVGINTANPAADLDVGGIFQVDTAAEAVQTSRYVKEFSGRIRGPSNWPECTEGAKTVYIGEITDTGSNSFITIELFGSHRGFERSNNYFDYKKWVIMAGDKVSSNLVSASGGGDKVNLYNGSSTGNYNNIEIGSGFNIRLRVNPQCGSTMHYTYVVKYYSGANFTPHSTRYW